MVGPPEHDRVLVDSSAWIELVRQKGDSLTRDRLRELLINDQAVWCDVVRLELWRGAGGAADRDILDRLEAEIRSLEMSRAVWDKSCELARACRQRGQVVPTTDLMIYACAVVHGVELLHRDRHFDLLASLRLS